MFKGWSGSAKYKSEKPQSSMSGYLWKMKKKQKLLISQWDKRWLSIEGTQLKWYLNEDATIHHGFLEMDKITGTSPFEGGAGVFSFVIRSPDRNLLLRASSANERDKWIRAVAQQSDRVRSRLADITNKSATGPQKEGLAGKLDDTIRQLDRLDDNVRIEGGGLSSNRAGARLNNGYVKGRGIHSDERGEYDDEFDNDDQENNRLMGFHNINYDAPQSKKNASTSLRSHQPYANTSRNERK